MPGNLGIPMICFSDQTHQYYYHCPSVSEYISTEHREPKLNPDRLVVLPMKSVVQVSQADVGSVVVVVLAEVAAAIKEVEAAAASIVCATAHLESLNAVAVTALRTTTSSRRSCTVLKNLRPYYIQHCVSCRCISCATTLLQCQLAFGLKKYFQSS